jgi:hypothetical protein
MPKLKCPCGFVHDLSPIPDAAWITVRDRDYEALVEAERRSDANNSGPRAFVRLTGRIYECPECRRIMWEKAGHEGFVVFRPENDA